MASLNVSLPDDLKAFAESESARRGFTSVGDFLISVLRESQSRSVRRNEVDALLIEGLESGPATPMSDDDWSEIHRTLEARHSSRSNG